MLQGRVNLPYFVKHLLKAWDLQCDDTNELLQTPVCISHFENVAAYVLAQTFLKQSVWTWRFSNLAGLFLIGWTTVFHSNIIIVFDWS